jgi:hypothetical protein
MLACYITCACRIDSIKVLMNLLPGVDVMITIFGDF